MFKNLIDDIKNLFVTKKQLTNFDYLNSVKEEDYPRILKKIVNQFIKEKLNLSRPKTFIDKIQWLKLYDENPLKKIFIDKVIVREWVEEQIGKEYLIPAHQICDNFDNINFDELPKAFLIKMNNGEDREYRIKDKQKFLSAKPLFIFVKQKFSSWAKTPFLVESAFDLQYKGISPKIIIEEAKEIQDEKKFYVYCFNGEPKYSELAQIQPVSACVYEADFTQSECNFTPRIPVNFVSPTEEMKKAFEFSKKLSKDFKFVRVDWKILDGKLYFNRMNFAPQAGLIVFEDDKWNKELGELIKL